MGSSPALPWLVAPMGASAVLLFAVPASPLAQPWPVIGGNVVSALIGVTCAKFIGIPLAAASIAVGAAIAVMFALRCLHPPGGALALSAALGGPAITEFGYAFALSPVGLNTVLLLLTAVAYNNLCGRRYPHLGHSSTPGAANVRPMGRVGLTAADLDAALKQYNQMLDISRDDLEEILLRTQMQAYHRRFGELTCNDIMLRDVATVEFGTG
jgi:CBS domain-containing membrane protein